MEYATSDYRYATDSPIGSGYRKLTICGIHIHCGFHLQLRIPRQPKITKPIFQYFFMGSTNCSGFRKFGCGLNLIFFCRFRKIDCFWNNFEQYSVLAICPWSSKQRGRSKKSCRTFKSQKAQKTAPKSQNFYR